MSENALTVLLVEDNPGDARLVREMLGESRVAGFTILLAQSLAEAKMHMESPDIDVVLLDMGLPDSWGKETIIEIVKCLPEKPVVVLTGSHSEETGLEAIKYGAQDYLVKGSFTPGTLERVINYAIERKNIAEELRKARDREVSISSRIQQTLLLGTAPTDLPWVDFVAFTIPSQHVDGDFYDFIRYGDSCVDIIHGDVMGKGIPAALLGAAAKSYVLRAHNSLIYRHKCAELPSPEAIIAQVNDYIVDELMKLESFITLCYARLDATAGTLQFVDCGHTKTIHYRAADKSCCLLDGTNMPLGFSCDDEYQAVTVMFAPGDLFFFYSDGLSEARSPDGGFFGEQRIMDIIAANACESAEELARMVFYAVSAFTGTQVFTDDMTCVLAAIRERSPESQGAGVRLKTTSDVGELAGIREFTGDICARLTSPPLSSDETAALQLAVNEAATNIMKHAYGGRTDGWIEIRVFDTAAQLTITLRHQGSGFDRDAVPAPYFDGTSEGGFGLFIIEQCVDEVSYTTETSGVHVITLTKHKPQQEGDDSWNFTAKM
jgi:phosphoserine phosphatase RsbU/P